MSCQIIHEDSQGNEVERFWVETEVLRIGSDPNCQISIAGLPRYAATLQFRDGVYTVINRAQEAMQVNGARVPSNASTPWPMDAALQFDGQLALRLVFPDGDPTPTPRPFDLPYHEDEPEPPVDEPIEPDVDISGDVEQTTPTTQISAKSIKDAIQLAVTALCIVAAVVLLVFQDRLKNEPDVRVKPFGDIVAGLMEQEPRDPALRDIRTALQDARRLEVSGHGAKALAAYLRVRDRLLERSVTRLPLEFSDPAQQEAFEFVLHRVSVLE